MSDILNYDKEGIRQAIFDLSSSNYLTNYEGEWCKDVSIIISTFERPRCPLNLLRSIRQYYPTISILVCDSSKLPLFEDKQEIPVNIHWFTLPYENGHTVGASRNHLVKMCKTKYFFLCDDDHVFNKYTDLARMYKFLENSDFDIVGGCQGKNDYGTAIFQQEEDIVYQHFYQHHGLVEKGVVHCDRVSNSFMARTGSVFNVLWEDRVYAGEHAEFFLRASKAGIKIAQMNNTYVGHNRNCETATGITGKIFGWVLAHKDRKYQHQRDGIDNIFGMDPEMLEKKYCWEKNNIKKIVSVNSYMKKREFIKLMND